MVDSVRFLHRFLSLRVNLPGRLSFALNSPVVPWEGDSLKGQSCSDQFPPAPFAGSALTSPSCGSAR